jgi:hypothetical protein
LLTGVFQKVLDEKLDSLSVRAQIESQVSKFAAAQTEDPRGREAIKEAFVAGYRTISWVAAGLALASSMTAAALITTERRSR